MNNIKKYLDSRINGMKRERVEYEPLWKQLSRIFQPTRNRFLYQNSSKIINDIYNNTALNAKRILKSGLMAGITSPTRPWFKVVAPHNIEEKNSSIDWLNSVEKLMYRIYSTSNLYEQLPHLYEDLVVFGTGAMLVEQDFEQFIRCTVFNAGEYYLDINGDLVVDTFAREYEMTVYQVVTKYGIKNVTEQTKLDWENQNYGNKIKITHLIEPAKNYELDHYELDERFEFRSLCWEERADFDSKKPFLSFSGYRDFPLICPRWKVRAGDVWGDSPAMEVRGDALRLQDNEKQLDIVLKKLANPPMIAPPTAKAAQLSLLPGHVSYTDDPNAAFRPAYQTNPDTIKFQNNMQRAEKRINDAFYVNVLLLISQQDDVRSATEINAREQEKLLQLGPVVESFHNELDKLNNRTFSMIIDEAILGYKGIAPRLLPEIPPELLGQELKINYMSILDQAQRTLSASAIERFTQFGMQVASASPEVLDAINSDEIVRQMADSLGLPPSLFKNQEDIMQIREMRKQQQEATQNKQAMQDMIGGAKQMSDIPIEEGNALAEVIGASQGG